MGRLTEAERLPMLDAHIGHWTQANGVAGTPLELEPGFGLPQLQALRDAYHAKGEQITQAEAVDLPLLRAQRDAGFGSDASDANGVYFWLMQYKPMVRARLGARHPLTRIIPNLGEVGPSSYLDILHRFIDHWTRVNAALAALTPPSPPLTLGSYTLSDLQAAHALMTQNTQAIASAAEGTLPLLREERDALFGDVPDDVRDPASIIARLLFYHVIIETRFPNQPLSQSLPRIFPASPTDAAPPDFAFNFRITGQNTLKTWFQTPTNLQGVTQVFLKEGAFEGSQSFVPVAGVQALTWNGVLVVDDLDDLEIRDAQNRTLANGRRDASLPEPQ